MKTLVAMLALALAACAQRESAAIKTTVSALTAEPDKFSNKRVEVEGVLALGFEAMNLQDPLIEKPTEIWFTYLDYPSGDKDRRGFEKLSAAFHRNPKKGAWATERIVRVRIEGTFKHKKGSTVGFGHLGAYASELIIERVLEAAPCERK